MRIKLAPFLNVMANGTATLDILALTKGRFIDRLNLVLGGTFTKLMITDMRLKANAKVIWQDSGDRTDKRMQFRGYPANPNYLTIDFSEIRAKNLIDQKLGSLDTANLSTLSLEVDIAGATTPTLVAFAECSYQGTQIAEAVDLVGKVLNYPHQVSATSQQYPIYIPLGEMGGSLIRRIHIVPPASGITLNGVEIRKGGVPIFQNTLAVNNMINAEYGKTAQSGWLHVDFVDDQNISEGVFVSDRILLVEC